jgi:hypothetical protein
MRRAILVCALMLALPSVAFCNSNLVFTNAGGSVILSGSTLIGNAGLTSFTAANGTTTTGALGHVFYQTGMETGHVLTSTTDTWTFAAGGSFRIKSNGSGIPAGVVFLGTFTSPVTFVGTFSPTADGGAGAWSYTLTGQIAGTFGPKYGGAATSGSTTQITFDVRGHLPFSGFVRGKTGITTVAAVPEAGTLGLMGTGLMGLAFVMRRRLFQNR